MLRRRWSESGGVARHKSCGLWVGIANESFAGAIGIIPKRVGGEQSIGKHKAAIMDFSMAAAR